MKKCLIVAMMGLAAMMVEPLGAAPSAEEREALAAEFGALFDSEDFANAQWGVLVESLETGEVWYERNADKLFIPASNEKIPTTAAAYLSLGPDFRYETTVGLLGEVKDGVLHGDIVVFGQGDPTFYTRWLDDSRDHFRTWAGLLKERGITRVTGNVIGDDNAWDDTHTGSGWPLRGLSAWYYAEYSALQFNENYVDISVQATEDGRVTLTPNVPSRFFTLVNQVTAVDEGGTRVRGDRPNDSNVITVTGQAAMGRGATEISPTITNPTLFFTTVMLETLMAEGITIEGNAIDCDDIRGWSVTADGVDVLVRHQSPPLSEIGSMLMKRSQNMFAESFVYTMGWKATGLGTFDAGREVVREKLLPFGVAPDEFVFMDGSGLSRNNLISPRTIHKINRGMYNTPLRDLWLESQPIAGVDGTLRGRMRGTAAEGNVRAKTGTLSRVRALSGYVDTAEGEKLLFSTLLNNYTAAQSAADGLVETMLVRLAEFKSAAGE